MTEEEREFCFVLVVLRRTNISLEESRLLLPDSFSRPMGRMHTGMATAKRPRPDGRVK